VRRSVPLLLTTRTFASESRPSLKCTRVVHFHCVTRRTTHKTQCAFPCSVPRCRQPTPTRTSNIALTHDPTRRTQHSTCFGTLRTERACISQALTAATNFSTSAVYPFRSVPSSHMWREASPKPRQHCQPTLQQAISSPSASSRAATASVQPHPRLPPRVVPTDAPLFLHTRFDTPECAIKEDNGKLGATLPSHITTVSFRASGHQKKSNISPPPFLGWCIRPTCRFALRCLLDTFLCCSTLAAWRAKYTPIKKHPQERNTFQPGAINFGSRCHFRNVFNRAQHTTNDLSCPKCAFRAKATLTRV
jgi:hypothetical protein